MTFQKNDRFFEEASKGTVSTTPEPQPSFRRRLIDSIKDDLEYEPLVIVPMILTAFALLAFVFMIVAIVVSFVGWML